MLFLLKASLKRRKNLTGRHDNTGSVDNRRLIRADSFHDVTAYDSIVVVVDEWMTIS